MVLIKDVTDCSTTAVYGLDAQLIAQMNSIWPNLLVPIDDLNCSLGEAVHPWLQSAARVGLSKAITERRACLTINSAYRTIAAQMLLRLQYENGRCGITAAAPPGQSNHNNASAIDVEDSHGWQPFLEKYGWKWLGNWDSVHFDHLGCKDIHSIAVLAFQQLWNKCHPNDRIAEDGFYGPVVDSRLRYSPAEGFPGVTPGRILCLTDPVQSGKDVGALQLALRKAGIKIDKADMVFSPSLQMAVEEFQQKHGLIVDGVVGTKTQKLLGLP